MRNLADKVSGPMAQQFNETKTAVEKLNLLAKILNDLGYRGHELCLPFGGQTTS